jgi:hypothetical protein
MGCPPDVVLHSVQVTIPNWQGMPRELNAGGIQVFCGV